MEISSNGEKLDKFIFEKVQENELTNEDLVQIIISCASYLNLKTISQYAKENNKTYKGVADFNKNQVEILNKKYIIDNE